MWDGGSRGEHGEGNPRAPRGAKCRAPIASIPLGTAVTCPGLAQAAPLHPEGLGGHSALGALDLGPRRAPKVYYPRIPPAKFIPAISVKSLCGVGENLRSEL